MIEDRDRPSTIVRIITPVICAFIGIPALLWFGVNLYTITGELLSSSSIIVFDKGAFYLLGVGLGALTLAFVAGFEYWLDKPLTKRLNILCTKMALISVAVAILLPQVSHFSLHRHLVNNSYTVCREASHQWLTARTIVYLNSTENCHGVAEKRRIGE
jgi:hypothetical protein